MGEGNARPRLRFVDLPTRQCRASGSRGSRNPGHSAGPALWVSGKPAIRPLTVPYRRVWPRRGNRGPSVVSRDTAARRSAGGVRPRRYAC